MHNPQHVLVIPDGNRRWAEAKGKPAFFGHMRGVSALREILKTSLELGIPYFTFWGMSLDNFTKRSPAEVRNLLQLFKREFASLARDKEIHAKHVRVNVLGRWNSLFPEHVTRVIRDCMLKTKQYHDHCLTLLLAYNGKDELTDAVRKISLLKQKDAALKVTEDLIKKNLSSRDMPPVDLVIRTGGEPHLSGGLMMWDTADAQLYFTETLWPDFSPQEFKKAVERFSRTERRMGR